MNPHDIDLSVVRRFRPCAEEALPGCITRVVLAHPAPDEKYTRTPTEI